MFNIRKALEIRDRIRCGADIAIDAASSYGLDYCEKKLIEINECACEKLQISTALNIVVLAGAGCAIFFIREGRALSLLIASIANYVLLGRALFNIIRFSRSILLPYHTLIVYLLPLYWVSLKKNRTFKAAIQDTIRAAVRFYYNKMPGIGQITHKIFSAAGLVKDRAKIEDKAAEDFYPIVCRFLRVVLLENVLLFGVCYGAFIFIIKQFIFKFMLNMNFYNLFVYPFVFIRGLYV